MKVQLVNIRYEEKIELEALLLEHLYELETKSKQLSKQDFHLNYPYLDLYWAEAQRKAYWIKIKKETVGFVMINAFTLVKRFDASHSIAEFYIVPKFRRHGIGRLAIFQLLNNTKGIKWETRQASNNLTAQLFWRTIINEYTNSNFKEVEICYNNKLETVQLFES